MRMLVLGDQAAEGQGLAVARPSRNRVGQTATPLFPPPADDAGHKEEARSDQKSIITSLFETRLFLLFLRLYIRLDVLFACHQRGGIGTLDREKMYERRRSYVGRHAYLFIPLQ